MERMERMIEQNTKDKEREGTRKQPFGSYVEMYEGMRDSKRVKKIHKESTDDDNNNNNNNDTKYKASSKAYQNVL